MTGIHIPFSILETYYNDMVQFGDFYIKNISITITEVLLLFSIVSTLIGIKKNIYV
jgi:hypothetical protein